MMQARHLGFTAAIGVMASLLLIACGPKKAAVVAEAPATSAPQEQVLAKVNGEAITDLQLELAMERSFSGNATALVDGPELRQKMLQSLVVSRAMKQLGEKSLDAETKLKLHNQAQAYEEELYVREYLKEHIQPKPVTHELVAEYYQKHPELYGAQSIREYQLLATPEQLLEQKRDDFLAQVAAIRATPAWPSAAAKWQQEFDLQLVRGRSSDQQLPDELAQALAKLGKDATSDLLNVNGRYYLLRVTSLIQTPAKPLAEVSGEIRQTLAPLALRDAVREASEQAKAQAKIEWLTPKTD